MTVRNLDALLAPGGVLALGAPQHPTAVQLDRNLRQSVPAGSRWRVGGIDDGEPSLSLPDAWPGAAVAVMMDPIYAQPEVIDKLGAGGCRALIWPLPEPVSPRLLAAMRPFTMRLLGSRSGGVCTTFGYNLSALPTELQQGTIALIAQSQSVAAAAADWAAGRSIGLSWVAVTGAEQDVDVADLLDQAALDPRTRAVALQLSRIRSSRKFMSAARAAARIKPVVVLQTQPLVGGGDMRLRSAAFQRAGLVECTTLGGLFDAIAALSHLPVPEDGRIAVAGNGAGACALAVDALRRQGLAAAAPPPELEADLRIAAPQVRLAESAVDLGHASVQGTVEALRLLLATPSVDALLYVHSPDTRESHEAIAAALTAAGLRDRLLTVWLGLQSAIPARNIAALGGIATFPSADEAARALRYRRQHQLTRELLMQTPPPARINSLRSEDAAEALATAPMNAPLPTPVMQRLLEAYGLPPPEQAPLLRIDVSAALDDELGMYLRVAPQVEGLQAREACAFAPLDPLLARRLLADAGVLATTPAVASGALPEKLVHVAQMVIDHPELAGLHLVLGVDAQGGIGLLSAEGRRAVPPQERQRLALAPYPMALRHWLPLADGRRLSVRPVRASDEPGVIGLLQRLDPDEVRLRFFTLIRNFTHDMAARMTQVDYDRELSLVVTPEQDPRYIIAMATLAADPDNREAEFAVLVHHDWVARGIGKHLLGRLLDFARSRRIGRVFGDVLAENGAMLAVSRSLGFKPRRHPDDAGCIQVSIDLGA